MPDGALGTCALGTCALGTCALGTKNGVYRCSSIEVR